MQGNIIAILDNTGNVVVKYVYDAWGNHKVVDVNGNEVISGIGVLNPFRYRGYYYDTETGLYYLQTRYYDPEVGRFISQDSVEYADPEKINGINLYAYCGNNPVMNVDPTGRFFFTLLAVLATLAVGTLVGGISGGISASATGGDFWAGFAGGAVSGLISTVGMGIAVVAGGVFGALIASVAGLIAGFSGSVVQQGISNGWDKIDYNSAFISSAATAISSLITFGVTNFAMRASVGLFENYFDLALKFSTRIVNSLSFSLESLIATIMFSFPVSIGQTFSEIVINKLKT